MPKGKCGADGYAYETRVEQTEEIIDKILGAYQERRGTVPMNLLPKHGNKNTLTGVSEGSLKEFLGGNWKPLIDLIVSGKIKGWPGGRLFQPDSFGDMMSVPWSSPRN